MKTLTCIHLQRPCNCFQEEFYSPHLPSIICMPKADANNPCYCWFYMNLLNVRRLSLYFQTLAWQVVESGPSLGGWRLAAGCAISSPLWLKWMLSSTTRLLMYKFIILSSSRNRKESPELNIQASDHGVQCHLLPGQQGEGADQQELQGRHRGQCHWQVYRWVGKIYLSMINENE